MELIFIKEPIIGILTLVIAALDFASGFTARRSGAITSALIAAVNILLHVICLTLIMLRGGGYEGALILVLMSCVITLATSPKPSAADEKASGKAADKKSDREVKA